MVDAKIARLFGQTLRRLRLEAGLTQEQLAERSGMHRTYIGPVERGKKNVTLDTANKLAVAVGTSLSAIILIVEDQLRDEP